MSAILSADDLNDFISPGVACIKPVETLSNQQPSDNANPYEVTTEDKVAAANAPPASISLTDCLACSGCVTSAEAVLVSLQSHAEVLNTLDAYPEMRLPWTSQGESMGEDKDGKIFVASVSPQTRASIAVTYGVSEREAGYMITQLLSGPQGLQAGGQQGSAFTWVIDTNVMREATLVAAADEVINDLNPSDTLTEKPKQPILASACPGWICYAEKTHPHVLPHISRLKSPQALTGTLIKSVLARKYNIPPDRVWHMAIMPCFDKKLEASREELTDIHWTPSSSSSTTTLTTTTAQKGIRDVDCVITARELLMLADARSISFPSLPRKPLRQTHPFPDPTLSRFLFPSPTRKTRPSPSSSAPEAAGTSGGYLWHILQTYASRHPDSHIVTQRGRNADVVEYSLISSASGAPIVKAARYYGFRNIQNLVRRLKPAKVSRMPGAAAAGRVRKPGGGAAAAKEGLNEYVYVEVMACPGGCTNGGGQIKVGDVGALRGGGSGVENGSVEQVIAPAQKEWLASVDEAYFSASSSSSSSSSDAEDEDEEEDNNDGIGGNVELGGAAEKTDLVDGIDRAHVHSILRHWAQLTDVDVEKLIYTSYRKVMSDVGKTGTDVEKVISLSSSVGGGW